MCIVILHDLAEHKLIHPPKWLPDNTAYLAIVGSESYGANLPGTSDQDLQGFCIPPKSDVFPHLRGEIPGFGRQHQRFGDWQEHKVTRSRVKKLCADLNISTLTSLEDVEAEIKRREIG
jgi:hypothetical protein